MIRTTSAASTSAIDSHRAAQRRVSADPAIDYDGPSSHPRDPDDNQKSFRSRSAVVIGPDCRPHYSDSIAVVARRADSNAITCGDDGVDSDAATIAAVDGDDLVSCYGTC